jgi:hypothetical protein
MTEQQPAAPVDVRGLRHQFDGRVIAPGDDGYDRARQVFYGGWDKRPAAIVRPVDAAEVARVVSLASDSGAELAVRGGAHSTAGHSTTEGGIVLDLSALKALQIDRATSTAWAQTGLTAIEYSTAADAHGLATGFGDTGSVGIGGLTLGGGIGYLVRKHGLTIDDLLAAEVVTADGQVLEVDAEHHPDLFWALRGGGGNFGVATRLRLRLHPVDTVVGGMLLLPATAETVAGFVAAAEAAPEELSTIANVMPAPPFPFVPPEAQGRLVILALVAYAGDTAAGERAVDRLRALGPPLVDMVKPIRYPEMYPPEEDLGGEEGYHPTAVGENLFLDAVDDAVAATIMEHLEASDAAVRVAQLRVLGGAMARVPADATAFAHRDRRIMVNVASFYEGDEDRPGRQRWVDGFAGALRDGDQGAYVNFLGEVGPERIRGAYPGATWDRLVEVKRRYDPGNLFRRNQNIPPASNTG